MAKLTLPHGNTGSVGYYATFYWICCENKEAATILTRVYDETKDDEDWIHIPRSQMLSDLLMTRAAFDSAMGYLVSSGILLEQMRHGPGRGGKARFVSINQELWGRICAGTRAYKEMRTEGPILCGSVVCVLGMGKDGVPETGVVQLGGLKKKPVRPYAKQLRGICRVRETKTNKPLASEEARM